MKAPLSIPISLVILLTGTLLVLTSACTTNPPQPAPVPQPVNDNPAPAPDENEPAGDPVAAIELQEIIDWSEEEEGEWDIPDSLIFSVDVDNVDVEGAESLGVNFVYEALVPSGETTFVLRDPSDPDSGYIEDSNGPVLHEVLEILTGRIESIDSIDLTQRTFDVTRPEDTWRMRYWVEVYVIKTTGHGEEVFVDTPSVTVREVMEQGRIINET